MAQRNWDVVCGASKINAPRLSKDNRHGQASVAANSKRASKETGALALGVDINNRVRCRQARKRLQNSSRKLAEMGKLERVFVMGVSNIEDAFPKIRKAGYKITSPETLDYNCFAWVAEDASQWWSPGVGVGYFWPIGVPTKLEIASFVKLYESHGGFSVCSDARLEKGFEKIAIYANESGEATHAARQTKSGRWTSKLGDWEDIEHSTLEALEGEFYGKAVQILKRAVT